MKGEVMNKEKWSRLSLLIKVYLKYINRGKEVTSKQIAEFVNGDEFGLKSTYNSNQIANLITRNKKNKYFKGIVINEKEHLKRYRWGGCANE